MAEPLQPSQVAIIRSFGGLTFDATIEEAHESELIVTDNPVETGVIVSDHAFMAPLRLTITAIVSDTPLIHENEVVLNDPFSSDSTGRSRKAFELLTQLQRQAEPFNVQTNLVLYRNMICTSIRTVQDKNSSGWFEFVASLREVIITYTKVINYPPRKAGTTRRQSSAKKQRGEQQSLPPPMEESLLLKGVEKLFGGF